MSAENIADESNGADAEVAETATKRVYPKTHANYWKSRLEHRSYSRDRKTFEVAEWSVRIHFKGIRKSFDLETANKEEAAAKARDIYLSFVAKGWSATVNGLAPPPVAVAEIDSDSATVGEFLAEVKRTANLKPKTFRYYGSCLRQLAAYVQGGKSDASRFDCRKGGFRAWRQQVDATPLSALTPAAAADYKMLRLKKAGNDPRRKLEVNRSFNSWLRCAKSLFSEAIICKPNFRVKVPRFKVRDGQRGERDVYWFETVSFERQGSMKFQAPTGITYEALVTNARQELRAASPEAYKLFLLCLCAGLRRGEADNARAGSGTDWKESKLPRGDIALLIKAHARARRTEGQPRWLKTDSRQKGYPASPSSWWKFAAGHPARTTPRPMGMSKPGQSAESAPPPAKAPPKPWPRPPARRPPVRTVPGCRSSLHQPSPRRDDSRWWEWCRRRGACIG
jgi:hypothetical protein